MDSCDTEMITTNYSYNVLNANCLMLYKDINLIEINDKSDRSAETYTNDIYSAFYYCFDKNVSKKSFKCKKVYKDPFMTKEELKMLINKKTKYFVKSMISREKNGILNVLNLES